MNRLLGPEELKFWLFDRRAPTNTVALARLGGAVDADALRTGFRAAQARHPLLRVRVDDGGALMGCSVPRFVDAPGRPIALEVTAREDDDHARRHAEAELARGQDPAGPLARATLLRGDGASDLVLAVAHHVADARGTLTLLADVLAAAGGETLRPLPESPSCELLVPPEAFGNPRAAERLAGWWSRRNRDRLAALPVARLAANLPAVGPTRLHAAELADDATAALAARCRAEATTVHGALVAALLLVLAGDREETLSCVHAIDLRRRTEPPLEGEVSLCLSHVTTRHATGPAVAFWDLAREARQAVTTAVATGEDADHLLDSLDRLGGDAAAVRAGLAPAATVTNVGRLDLEARYGAIELHGAVTAGSVSADGPVLSAATSGGRLRLLLAHPATWSRAREAPRLAGEVAARLARAAT